MALGIDVRKVIAHDRDPVKSVLAFLKPHPADLIVLATHQHEGRSRWLQRSVAEPWPDKPANMTLFIPHGVEGFVLWHDGAVSLQNILIPIAQIPRAQPAMAAAVRLVHRLQCPAGTFTTLFIGAPGDAPAVRCPTVPGWQWNCIVRSGDVIDAIVQMACYMATDLIVMATHGRKWFPGCSARQPQRARVASNSESAAGHPGGGSRCAEAKRQPGVALWRRNSHEPCWTCWP